MSDFRFFFDCRERLHPRCFALWGFERGFSAKLAVVQCCATAFFIFFILSYVIDFQLIMII